MNEHRARRRFRWLGLRDTACNNTSGTTISIDGTWFNYFYREYRPVVESVLSRWNGRAHRTSIKVLNGEGITNVNKSISSPRDFSQKEVGRFCIVISFIMFPYRPQIKH